MMHSSIHLSDESERKQPPLPAYVVSAYKQMSSEKMTKGRVVYSALLMDSNSYTDEFSRIESNAFAELEREGTLTLSEMVEKIIFCPDGIGATVARDKCEYEDTDEQLNHNSLWFPTTLTDQITGRGFGSEIQSAVEALVSAPWNSRIERVEIVQQLAEFCRTKEIGRDWHEFTLKVLKEDYPVDDVHLSNLIDYYDLDAIRNELPTNEESRYQDWDRFDFLENASDLKVDHKPRVDAMHCVIINEGGMTKNACAKLFDDALDIAPNTLEKYLGKIDWEFLWDETDSTYLNLDDQVAKIAEEVRKDSKKVYSDDYRQLGLDNDFSGFHGLYSQPEHAEDALMEKEDYELDDTTYSIRKGRRTLYNYISEIAESDKSYSDADDEEYEDVDDEERDIDELTEAEVAED